MLSPEDLHSFRELGVVHVKPGLGIKSAKYLIENLPDANNPPQGSVMEADGVTLRAIHGGHKYNPAYKRLTRLTSLLGTAEQILGTKAYVYQFKVNMKVAFNGAQWPWHDDYAAWRIEDGMPSPNALTAAIFLDPVTEFNGPLYFIPGSHKTYEESDIHSLPEPDEPSESWVANFGATLRYQAPPRHIDSLITKNGIVSPKGDPGSVVFFDSRVIHASPPNITPIHRRILYITYNSVENLPRTPTRPEFLVDRDHRPLERLSDSALLETPWPMPSRPY